MTYQITMLHGKAELKQFGRDWGFDIKAENRVAFVASLEDTVLFLVDAVEVTTEGSRPDFQLNVICFAPKDVERWSKPVGSFFSTIAELDRVYRRFATAVEDHEKRKEPPHGVYNLLRGMMVGMQIAKII